MRNKLRFMVLTIIVVLCMTACGGKKTEEPAPKAEKAEEVTAEPVEDTEEEAQA